MAKKINLENVIDLMLPKSLVRRIRSFLMNQFANLDIRDKKRQEFESRRQARVEPHKVLFFFQSNDPYSALAAQFLHRIKSAYNIQLEICLVGEEGYDALPEPEMYRKYVFNDVQKIAPYYGIDFEDTHIPSNDAKNAFLSHLCTLNQHELISDLPELSLKFWKGEFVGNSCSENTVQNVLDQGNRKRDKCNHYLGGIFHYGGENYWGVDRINLLLERLDDLKANKANSLRINPAISKSSANYNTSNVRLELFFSANSPYTYLSFDRIRKLGKKYNIPIVVRPIKPMLMRGMGISRRKGFYILSDCARIAEKLGIPFGKIRIATGLPLTRIYSLFPYVNAKGKGFDYLYQCMKGVFSQAKDISSKTFLRKVLIDLDLNPDKAFVHLDSKEWESSFEKNRLAMYKVNSWGAPTFKLLHQRKNILSTWGQDRIWLIEEELKKL